MKITKTHKKFIKGNYKNLTATEMSQRLGIPEKEVSLYLKKERKEAATAAVQDEIVIIKSLRDIKLFFTSNFVTLLALLMLMAAVYANSLGGQFVSDDLPAIVNNPAIKDFSAQLSTFYLQSYIISFIYIIFGPNPVIYHLLSLIVHTAAVFLMFLFVSMLFNRRIATIAAFIYAVHPVNVEAVSWISGINYVYNGISFLLTAITFILFKRSKEKKYLAASAAVYLISTFLFRFPQSVVTPLLLLIVDQVLVERKIKLKPLLALLPHFVIALLFVVYLKGSIGSRVLDLQSTIVDKGAQNASYAVKASYSLFNSFKLLAYPMELSLYQEGEVLTPNGVYFMFAFAAVLGISILFLYKKDRIIVGLLTFIIVSILTTLSPVQIGWYVAERYLYIGAIAFSVILALLIARAEKVIDRPKAAFYITFVIVLLFSIRTILRNNDWATPKNLWLATVKVSSNSPKVHNNLGDIYSFEGELDKAVVEFQKAIELEDGKYPDAMHNLGLTYLSMGKYAEAEVNFLSSLELNPGLWQSYYHLAVLESQRGNNAKVKEYLQNALQLNPNNPDLLRALDSIKD